MTQNLIPFAIALLIGLFIGIERERAHPAGTQAMGVRTFVLLALLGTLAAELKQPIFIAAISAFAFGAILLSYLRGHQTVADRKRQTIGITTEIAGGVVYVLGYLTASKPLLASILGVIVLLMLLSRKGLHSFSRDTIKTKEVYAATTILVIGLAIVPLLPDRAIDPWQILNLRRFGVIVLLLSIIQFGGYVAIRMLGQRTGMILTGFLGGLVSSTAVFATLPRMSRHHPDMCRPLVVSAIFANMAMLIELSVVLFVVSRKIGITFIPIILSMIAVGSLSYFVILRYQGEEQTISAPSNPLDLLAVFRLAIFIGGMLALVSLAKRYIGNEGVNLVSAFGGLFEIHSVSIANATLFSEGKLALNETKIALGVALLASFVSKFFLLWTLARNRFAMITSLFLIGMVGTGLVVFLLT